MQYTPAPGKVGLGGNWKSNSGKERVALDQLGIGTVIIRTSDAEITLHNVLHVPDADEHFFPPQTRLLVACYDTARGLQLCFPFFIYLVSFPHVACRPRA